MSSKKIFFILLFFSSAFLHAQISNQAVTSVNANQQQFSNWLNEKWQSDQNKIQSFINQKNITKWSKDHNGNISLFYGFSPNGLPEYITTTYSTLASVTVGTNNLWEQGSSGLNLFGNISILKNRVGIWDSGRPLNSHIELASRVSAGDTGAIGVSSHSTSVAGIIMDKGINVDARGMSYGLQGIVSYDFYNDIAEMSAASSFLLLSNHSYVTKCGWYYGNTSDPSAASRWEFWGGPKDTVDYNFGYYGSLSQNVDSIVFNAPYYTIVKAAGNNRTSNGPAIGDSYWRRDSSANWFFVPHRDSLISSNNGYDIISTMGNAKNIITIGSIFPIINGYSQPSDVQLTSYSSWGPTDDGRIKPDIVAPGENILSASSASDSSYNLFGGTSAATPVVTGSLLLLQQLYYQMHNQFIHAATVKALVVHTANAAGTSPGPNYQSGWGLLNVSKSADVIRNLNYNNILFERRLLQGSDTSFKVIASGNGPLTFTICWTDPPGTIDSINYRDNHTPKLINDLDIAVTDGSSLFLPWTLDVNNPSLPATQKNNSVDNVEKIEIPNAIAGKEYKVTISHKNILRNGFQDYSFVASGVNGVKTSDENPFGLVIIPNPVLNNCLIRFKAFNNSNAVITLFDVKGKRLKQETITPTIPITNYSLDVSFLSKGIYFINMQQNGVSKTVKMEKL